MTNDFFLNSTKILNDLLAQEEGFVSKMNNFSKLAEGAKRRTQITFKYLLVIKEYDHDYEIQITSQHRLTLEQLLMRLFFSETNFRETKNEMINNVKMVVEFGCQDGKEIDHKIIFDKGRVHNFHYRYRWGVQEVDSETPIPLDSFRINTGAIVHVEQFIPDSSFTSLDSKLPDVFLSKNNVMSKTRMDKVLFVHLILDEDGKRLYEVYGNRKMQSGEVLKYFSNARGFNRSVLIGKIITYSYDENGLLLSTGAESFERVRIYIGNEQTEQRVIRKTFSKPIQFKKEVSRTEEVKKDNEIYNKALKVDELVKKAVEKVDEYQLALHPKQLGFNLTFESDSNSSYIPYIIVFSVDNFYYAVKCSFPSKVTKQQLLQLFFKSTYVKEKINIVSIIGEFSQSYNYSIFKGSFEDFIWFNTPDYDLDHEELNELNSYMSKKILELSDFY